MAALKTLGDWLKGSGLVQALVQAGITTSGTADSFLRATHVTPYKASSPNPPQQLLYIVQRRAYDRLRQGDIAGTEMPSFDVWC